MRKRPRRLMPIATSYETIWLAARRPPRRENLLSLAQPAIAAPTMPRPPMPKR
jgi:hypothetical protein